MRLAMLESEIGKAALRIGKLLRALNEEVREFLVEWPDDEVAEAASITAITSCGFDHPDTALLTGFDYGFDGLPECELRRSGKPL